MKVNFYRAVIDTNVLISAALSPRSTPAGVVRHFSHLGRMLFSEATFAELETRLWRPKFDRYVTIESRNFFLQEMRSCSLWTKLDPEARNAVYSRDPDDDKFIHTALAGKADVLISGDQDLLVLGAVKGLLIVSPIEALRVVQLT